MHACEGVPVPWEACQLGEAPLCAHMQFPEGQRLSGSRVGNADLQTPSTKLSGSHATLLWHVHLRQQPALLERYSVGTWCVCL